MSAKRFRIAFSFAGEKRAFVKEVADHLAGQFSQDAILYDKFANPAPGGRSLIAPAAWGRLH